MRTTIRLATCLLLGFLMMAVAGAATFTYHGSLQDGGRPAEGAYDIELTLYSSVAGSSVIGGPLVMYNVPVHAGSFSTEADFGSLSQSFSQAFVGVRVRSAGKGDYAALNGRSQVTAATAASVCPGAWTLNGNAGNPAGSYLGTADTQPLTFEVNGLQVGKITPSSDLTNNPDAPNVVFGSSGNVITGGIGATIAGGGATGGSFGSTCGPSSNQPCINSATGVFATVGGGDFNTASGQSATVGGGYFNTTTAYDATVGGGQQNTASGQAATLGGGYSNTASGSYAVIGGGAGNSASGERATVVGGGENQAGGDYSLAAGLDAKVRDSGLDAYGANNSGTCTIGTNCGDAGTFVWADATGTAFVSSGPNQFLIRAGGHVGINTNAPRTELHVQNGGGAGASFTPVGGTLVTLENDANASLSLVTPAANESAILFGNPANVSVAGIFYNYGNTGGMYFNTGGVTQLILASNGQLGVGTTTFFSGHEIDTGSGAYLTNTGVWTNNSSRNIKEGFAAIDTGAILAKVLELPITSWRYKQSDDRHIGPTAEDFKAAFGLGSDEQHIGTVDEEGVALAAIQALAARVEEENADLQAKNGVLTSEASVLTSETSLLRTQNADLQARLDDLASRLGKLETRRGQ